MEIIYRANDGMFFEDEDAFFSYERRIKELQDHIEEYDDILKKLNQEVK